MKTGHEKSFARHFPTAARILMGLLFFAGGLANLLNLTPQTPLPEGASAFANVLAWRSTSPGPIGRRTARCSP
jgi:hypothetical protein